MLEYKISISQFLLVSLPYLYCSVHSRYHSPDPGGPQEQLRDPQDTAGPRLPPPSASRRQVSL